MLFRNYMLKEECVHFGLVSIPSIRFLKSLTSAVGNGLNLIKIFPVRTSHLYSVEDG